MREAMALWILWMLSAVSLLVQEGCSELTISGCEDGRVDVVEDRSSSFTCGRYDNRGAVWTVYSDKGQILYRGSCRYTSCSYPDGDFFLGEWYLGYFEGIHFYTSSLTITRMKRDSARILNCSSSSESTVCELRIIADLVYKDGSCSVGISNWMVTGSCTVTGMYSSDNNYNCKWRESWSNEEMGGFQTKPVTYTARNSRNYTKGVCSFAKPMPLTSGYYIYTMTVSPGGVYFQKTITIDKPYQIQLTHSCPKYVFEGSSLNCSCFASRDVTPPALLVWEGRKDSTFLLTNVSWQQNQKQFTCQLTWGPDGFVKENTSYKLDVAYGPSDVLITSYTKKTEDESERTSLTCTATDVYPSAVFQWNVTCYNQTDSGDSSTCFLNSTQKFESLAILCTASNKYYHQANASHVYVISSLRKKQTNTAGHIAALIGGILAAVLVVLIIVAVLIVYIIKRRKGNLDGDKGFLRIFLGRCKHSPKGPEMSQPNAVVNKPKTQRQKHTPIRRQAGPLGDMYTFINTISSGHVAHDLAAVCGTVNNNTGGTESPDTQQTIQKTQRIKEPTASLKLTTQPTITNRTNVQDLHDTGYMNVTVLPTDSGLGVYHAVPRVTLSESTELETREYFVPTIFEDEYNELHFEEDRTGQEDQADNYHHLQIT